MALYIVRKLAFTLVVVLGAAWLFLFYPKQVVLTRSNIKGVELLPTEHILFAKAVKDATK